MKLAEALPIARRIVALLAPSCDRLQIAGSVRRRKADVGDIEIVCIPRTLDTPELFGPSRTCIRDPQFTEACQSIGKICKGSLTHGKYMQFWVEPGIQLDLFTATADNWGLIYAIRTGSARFSHEVLARGWCRAGYHSMEGMLVKRSHKTPVREERDLFDLIGIPWVEPEERV